MTDAASSIGRTKRLLRRNRATQAPVHAYTIDDADLDEAASHRTSVPRWPFVVLAVASAALVTSALIPRGDELHKVKADTAATRAELESAVARGDTATTTVLALAEERLQAGEADGAATLIAQHLSRHALEGPALVRAQDVQVRALLAARRKPEAMALMASLQQQAPSIERQRLWVKALAGPGDEAPHLLALSKLVHGFPGAEASEYQALARRLMQAGAPRGAIDTLDAMARAHPGSLNADTVQQQMQALLAAGQLEGHAPMAAAQAMQRAMAWLKAHPKLVAVNGPKLADVLSQQSHHDQAAELLAPWVAEGGPDVAQTWTRAMQQLGRGPEAMNELARVASKGDADEWLRQRIKLALENRNVAAAVEAVQAHGFQRTDGQALATVVRAMLEEHGRSGGVPKPNPANQKTLHAWWAEGAQTKLANADGVLATQVAQAVGDHAAAQRLADAALPGCAGKPNCAVRLAYVNHMAGRSKEALAALRMAEEGDIEEAHLADYVQTAISVGYAREALAKLDRQRRAPASNLFLEAWAVVATSTGRFAEVQTWLGAVQPGEVSQDVLRHVFKAALDAKAHALAASVAPRLDDANIKVTERVMLAHALMDMGRSTDALTVWRQVRSQTNAYDDAYATALSQAMKRGVSAHAESELVNLLLTQVVALKLGNERDAMVTRLLELDAHARLVDVLEPMALSAPDRWLAAFETAATKAGRGDRITPVVRKVVAQDIASKPLRVQLALQLLDGGERAPAEQALRVLAADAGPTDPEAQRLLGLWGNKLTPEQLDWVEARAQGQPGARLNRNATAGAHSSDARAAWLRELNERGGASRTVSVYRRMSPKPLEGPVFDIYVDALTKLGDRAGLATALRDAATLSR